MTTVDCNGRAVLAEIEGRLVAAGVESPRVDAELLVGHVLGLSRSGVSAAGLRGSSAKPSARRSQSSPAAVRSVSRCSTSSASGASAA